MSPTGKTVTILGAGLAGLVIADALARRGCQVFVFELESEPGGLCRSMPLGGRRVERYYHHVFRGETAVVELVHRLGLSADFHWHRVRQGLVRGGRPVPYDNLWSYARELLRSPADLFRDLNLVRRLGSADFHLLDELTAAQWLRRCQSAAKVEHFWLPLLEKKYGPHAERVSARWLWERLSARKSSKRWLDSGEMLGHLAGGFFRLTDRLAEQCTAQGVILHYRTGVSRIHTVDNMAAAVETGQGKHPVGDLLISTLPAPVLASLLPDCDNEWVRSAAAVPYMACRCVTLLLSQSLSPYYWLSNLDPPEFAAIIEQSKFSPAEGHLVFLPEYFWEESKDDERHGDQAVERAVTWLESLFPGFDRRLISQTALAYDAYSQPVFLAGRQRQNWVGSLPLANLLATDTYLAYPEQRRNMNAALHRANSLLSLMDR